MALLDPIVEVNKPSYKDAKFLDTPLPENIKPILELLNARATPFSLNGVHHWEITTGNGMHYARIEQEVIGDDEDKWRSLIGMLLDYAKSQEGK